MERSEIRERRCSLPGRSRIPLRSMRATGTVGAKLAPRPHMAASAPHAMMRVTMPAPTVLSPSRMAKRDFSSIATCFISIRSSDGAKRNPGTMMQLARPLPHSAALHAGYRDCGGKARASPPHGCVSSSRDDARDDAGAHRLVALANGEARLLLHRDLLHQHP